MSRSTGKAYVALTLILAVAKLASSPALAQAIEDIAKAEREIEREIEFEEMKKRIENNTHSRVKYAISQTKQAQSAIKSCRESKEWPFDRDLAEEYEDRDSGELYEKYASKSEEVEAYIWSGCLSVWPFDRIYDQLFIEFLGQEINSEIERTYGSTEESTRERLEKTIRERSTRAVTI